MKNFWIRYINNWQSHYSSEIEKFRVNLLSITHLMGVVFIFFFAIYHFTIKLYFLGIVQSVILGLLIANILYFKKKRRFALVSNLSATMIFALFLLLIVDGGVSTTGLYWAHVFPLMLIMLKGNRVGMAWVLSFLLSMGVVLAAHYAGWMTLPYAPEKLIILIFSTVVVTIMVYSFEALRQLYRSKLELKTDEVMELNLKLEELARKLSKYISPQIYDSLFQGKRDVKITTERKYLTVFFSDLVRFTEISEELPFDVVTQLLNEYLDEMSQIALTHGATIDKFIGDSVMVFFGDPESKGVAEDALACVSMAKVMQNKLKELRDKWEGEGVSDLFHARMGIASGLCTVGNFGSENRIDYTVFGNVVNLASRLESIAEEGGIFISKTTYDLIGSEVDVVEKEAVLIKGFKGKIVPYMVV